MTNLAKQLEKINSELDISIESSENIINELKTQDKHIVKITKISESIEEKVTWSEYLINILNTYFGFLWIKTPHFLYKSKSNEVDENNNEGNENNNEDISDVTEDDEDFFNKIYKVRQNSEKIGDIIDRQNNKLTTQIDTIDKIDYKVNEVLINQINV
jgi:hypothetical protein